MDEVPARGAAFIDRMDAAGLVVLNGLCAVGDGRKAEATYGVRSVIDFILVDTDHWPLMESVQVVPGARGVVSSDHELITSSVCYRPVRRREPRSRSLISQRQCITSDHRNSVLHGNKRRFGTLRRI